MTLRRLVCLLAGHRPGAERFRYVSIPRELGQWPDRRGPTRLELQGRECDRCHLPLEERSR